MPRTVIKFGGLSLEAWEKVAKGMFIAAAGAAITYMTEALSGMDFGEWTPAITAAWAVLVNMARKFLAEHGEDGTDPEAA